METSRFVFFLLVVLFPPIVANLAAVWAQFPLSDLLFPQTFSMFGSGDSSFLIALGIILPFPVAFTSLTLWFWPFLSSFFRQERLDTLPLKVQKRVIFYPLAVSFSSLGGWVTAGLVVSLGWWIGGDAVSPQRQLVLWLNLLIFGGLSFVFTYYIVVLLVRKFLFPKVFPSGLPAEFLAMKSLGLGGQAVIFLAAVSWFPSLIGMIGILRWSGVLEGKKAGLDSLVYGVYLALLAALLLLSWLFFRTLARPLGVLDETAARIGKGETGVPILNWNTDEIGRLGHTLNVAAAGLAERERLRDRMGQIVDPQVRDFLMHNGSLLRGERTSATVLFVDLRGFTTWSEARSPEEVVEFLNRFYTLVSEVVHRSGGVVNKFLGDAALAVFGPPSGLAGHRAAGLSCALTLLQTWEARELDLALGLHSGEVMAGTVGSETRLEYTVLGDAVNTASRLEGHTRYAGYQLLASQAVFEASVPGDGWVALGPVRLRGKDQPLELWGYSPWSTK